MKQRDVSIDILRGIAIFTMIAANMAPYNYLEPHPFLFRIFGSVAAPMFVFLAGMMVSYTATIKSHPLKYYLKRGFVTITMAACIDAFIWDIFPFITYDVLYVIGLAMPLIYFFIKLKRSVQLTSIAAIFILTPLLQYYLGYTESPSEISFHDENGNAIPWSDINLAIAEIPVWKQFLIEGWFPFFPWIGVSLTGAFIGSFKFNMAPDQYNKSVGIAGAAMFVIGLSYWLIKMPYVTTNEFFNGSEESVHFWNTLITREGYSELFYPPTLFYFLTFIGGILILIPIVHKIQNKKILQHFTVFGKSSMLVYL
ncbi:MAG: DUF1624 domain-containing protein, partial [Crocinitomicaceae bacterium]|nr:DUF1624 domain-containing protein [Crocinitomicaceae bacterium]